HEIKRALLEAGAAAKDALLSLCFLGWEVQRNEASRARRAQLATKELHNALHVALSAGVGRGLPPLALSSQSCSNSDAGRRAFESWRAFCAGAHQVRQELRDARTSSAAEQTELWTAASAPGFREASLVEFEDIKIRPQHLWEECAELLAGRGVALDQAREAEAARDSLELRLARLQADMTSQEASLTERQAFLETERLDGDGLLESQAKILSAATQELSDVRAASSRLQSELLQSESVLRSCEASSAESGKLASTAAAEHDACTQHLREECAELIAGRGVALDQARQAEAARDSLELRLARLQADMTSQEASLTERQAFLETERLEGDGLLESQAKILSAATQELSDVRAASSRLQSELLQSESVLRSCEASSAESGKLASTAAAEHDACTQRLREECAELIAGRGVALDQARQAEAARDSLELRLARLQADMTSQEASLTERQAFLETERLDGDGLLESQAKILSTATQELSDIRAASSRLQSELLQSESVLRSCEASSAESGKLASTAAMVLEHDACTQRLREECAELLAGRGVALDQARQAEAARDSLELRLARLQADMTSQGASLTERQAFLETERLDGDGLLESQTKILSTATQELSDVRAASSRLQSELLQSESVLRSCEASSAESGKLASTAAAEHDACTQRLREECAELIAGRGVALDQARQAEAARDSLELRLARLQADMTSQEASLTERQAFLETERLDGDGLLESQAKILSAATQELSDVRAASSRLQSELLQSESVLRSCEASSAESGKLASTAAMVLEHDACTQRLREECAELLAGRGVALDQAREAEATISNLELQLARIEAECESRRFASVGRDMNVSEAAQRNKKKLHESNEKALSDMAKELCDVWAENDKLKSELLQSESALRSCEVNATARDREHSACTQRLREECAELIAGRGVALGQARQAEAARDSLELRLARLQADMTSQEASLTERQAFLEKERLDGDGLLESQTKILSAATQELSDVRAASSRLQSELLQSESVLRSCEASSAESGKLASTAAAEHDACTQRLREECAELIAGRGVALDQARQAEAARDSLELRLARLQADMTSQEASLTERQAFLETERLDGDGLLESQTKILSEATQELSDVRAASSRLQSDFLQSESVLRSCEASSAESGKLASTAAMVLEHDACTQRLREECAELLAGRGVALDQARQAEAARDSLELRLGKLQAHQNYGVAAPDHRTWLGQNTDQQTTIFLAHGFIQVSCLSIWCKLASLLVLGLYILQESGVGALQEEIPSRIATDSSFWSGFINPLPGAPFSVSPAGLKLKAFAALTVRACVAFVLIVPVSMLRRLPADDLRLAFRVEGSAVEEAPRSRALFARRLEEEFRAKGRHGDRDWASSSASKLESRVLTERLWLVAWRANAMVSRLERLA
ncbi:unnamed protein product, partial [Polarella glacialis]